MDWLIRIYTPWSFVSAGYNTLDDLKTVKDEKRHRFCLYGYNKCLKIGA